MTLYSKPLVPVSSVVTVSHWPRSVGFGWVLLIKPRFRLISIFWPAPKPPADV